ncbi:hypothetical protein BDV98DRAFT_223084 [Pterulicium gracile]|uniref:Uncharacterized protein n=1 Tax=Pterulicium gracile TaxID=1884261 RepID=A0A5C3QU40_9AGAR|nr:hypothetical protein BDV98DRAFT_223084 [Pterula gracilis]
MSSSLSSTSAAARTDSIPSVLTGCCFLAYAAIVVALPPFFKSLRKLLLFLCGKGVFVLRAALPPASSVVSASSSVLNFPSWYPCDYCSSSSSLLYPTFCCLLPYLRHHLPIYTQDFSHFATTSYAFSSPPSLFHPPLAAPSCCCPSTPHLHSSCPSYLHPPFRDPVARQKEEVEDCDTDDDVVVLYDVMI